MAEQLQTVKAKRAIIEDKLTRFKAFLNKFVLNESSDIIMLKLRLDKILPLQTEFDKIQDEIEIRTAVDDRFVVQTDEREKFEHYYCKLVSDAKKIIHNFDKAEFVAETKKDIKLPNVNLPSFDGSLPQWMFFRDTFISLIHDKQHLTNENKFHYLRTALKDEAATVLVNIHESNYEIAWNRLLERYDDETVLRTFYLNSLINLPQVTEESHIKIRDLLENMQNNLKALNTLGEPTESWDTLIIPIVSSKLDNQSKRKWASKSVKLGKASLNDFQEFLIHRCKVLQNLQNNDNNENNENTKNFFEKIWLDVAKIMKLIFDKMKTD